MRRAVLALTVLAATLIRSSEAHAQSWSLDRDQPSLREIVALDAVGGDTRWPYGAEDVAGDGASTLQADEAAVDLRSVYADARAGQLWLRAYVAAKSGPSATALAFFFIDSDALTSTGGRADDAQFWAGYTPDPTDGGYERALGLRGDGSLIGVFNWDAQKKQWVKQPEVPALAMLSTGVARDPLRLSGDDHGFFQVSLALSAAALSEPCNGTIFVRLANDAPSKRFSDDAAMGAVTCHPHLDGYGNPEPLHSDVCTADASCPAQGRCRDGLCVFAYECSADSGCDADEHCTGGVCVRVVDKTCKGTADCAGLLCSKAGRCVACADNGALACAAGWVCTPNGACLQKQATSPRAGGAATAAAGSGAKVRGGAFSCAALPWRTHGGSYLHGLLLGMCAAGWRRFRARARRQGGAR